MRFTPDERAALIDRYERGPSLLRAAWEAVPAAARLWRPAPERWSAHEVVCHCADSEANAMLRIRYLLAEEAPPTILGYDEHRWSVVLDYASRPVEPAFAVVHAVRANTVPLLHSLGDGAWERHGTHTERGRYTAEDWLETYAEHLEIHARQIERNLAAWRAAEG